MKRAFVIVAAVIALEGCVSNGRGRYVNTEDDVYGQKDRLEYPQKSRVVAEMVGRMLSDPDFSGMYAIAVERAEKRGHKRPTIVIRDIEDNTRPGASDFLTTSQMHKELKIALRNTKMFAIIDLYERARMADDMIKEPDGGGRPDNVQNFGVYEAGDFFMYGELTMESVEERVFYHFFNLRLVDPVTSNEIWSDTVKIGKM